MEGSLQARRQPRAELEAPEGRGGQLASKQACKGAELLGFLGPAAGKGPSVALSVTKLPSSLLCSPSPHTGPGAPSPQEATVHQGHLSKKVVDGGREVSTKNNSNSSASCLHTPGTNCPWDLGLKEFSKLVWLENTGTVCQGSAVSFRCLSPGRTSFQHYTPPPLHHCSLAANLTFISKNLCWQDRLGFLRVWDLH